MNQSTILNGISIPEWPLLSMELNHPYTAESTLSELKTFLEANEHPSIFLLLDANTRQYCLPELLQAIPQLKDAIQIEVPEGEANKTLASCEKLWAQMLGNQASRQSLMINLGGGMLCDLGGFAASVFKRGIPFVHIPTTFLAMTDAAIGGKTGVNFEGHKNQIGTFSNPAKTIIHPAFLKTLDERQFRSGFAEMLKHALIGSKKLWEQLLPLKALNLDTIEPLIWQSIKVKQTIVEKDQLETGERKKLNFGHTAGHALESYSLKHDWDPLQHGEAVALGILVESHIALEMDYLSSEDYQQITGVIHSHFPPYQLDESGFDELLDYMKSDKKNKKEGINFTLITQPGRAVVDCYPGKKRIQEGMAAIIKKG